MNLVHKMRTSAYKIIILQLLFVLFSTGLLAIFFSYEITKSALLGGLVCVLANFIFARKVFAHTGASQSRNIMKAFYVGELQKIIVTGLLIYIAIKYLNIVFLAFFLMYISAQISFWLASAILDIKVSQKKSNSKLLCTR